MEITIFNPRVIFKEVNLTTKIVPPLKEPDKKLCSSHGIMKVEKPRMAMFGVLEEKGIKLGLLVIPVCIGKTGVCEGCT
jgi:hypothetical protein